MVSFCCYGFLVLPIVSESLSHTAIKWFWWLILWHTYMHSAAFYFACFKGTITIDCFAGRFIIQHSCATCELPYVIISFWFVFYYYYYYFVTGKRRMVTFSYVKNVTIIECIIKELFRKKTDWLKTYDDYENTIPAMNLHFKLLKFALFFALSSNISLTLVDS